MKNNVLIYLLIYLFLVIQSASAKGHLDSPIDSSAPSSFMSDNELKIFGQTSHERHIEYIVVIYQKEIINGFKESKDREGYLQRHYDSNSRELSQCALIAAAKKNTNLKAPILDNHFIYFIRALATVIDDPKLEDNIAKKRNASYDEALLKVKQELKSSSPEHKQHHKLWKKKCKIVLKKVRNINRIAQDQRDNEFIQSRNQ